jgi:hypothetical protein
MISDCLYNCEPSNRIPKSFHESDLMMKQVYKSYLLSLLYSLWFIGNVVQLSAEVETMNFLDILHIL